GAAVLGCRPRPPCARIGAGTLGGVGSVHLESLSLRGFKSFERRVTLRFDRRITAVVGPNGSGKSNIADAVRWVLGEQSMQALRSKSLVDLIFAGTDRRAPEIGRASCRDRGET